MYTEEKTPSGDDIKYDDFVPASPSSSDDKHTDAKKSHALSMQPWSPLVDW